MFMKRRQNHQRQIQTRNGSIASCAKRKGQHDDEHSLDGQIKGYSYQISPSLRKKPILGDWPLLKITNITFQLSHVCNSVYFVHSGDSVQFYCFAYRNNVTDILCHIHSLMPIQDAARAACVSQTFLHSSRCRPNLDFSRETLGLTIETQRDITSIVDHILQNHSGIGVKAVKFQDDSWLWNSIKNQDFRHLDVENQDFSHLDLDRWLRNTIKPGIEELNISLHGENTVYNFPCSLLSDEIGESLRNLKLVGCYFDPTIGLGSLRNLRRIQLGSVSITDSKLECLLSNSFSLEQLVVNACTGLEVLESKAPNLSSVIIEGAPHVQLSLLESPRITKYYRSCPGAAFYARTDLPSSMPNLETLSLVSNTETVNTPVMPSKFLHLKWLSISLSGRGQAYDIFSLSSFFDASPFLETFKLNAPSLHVKRASIFEDRSDLRKMPEKHSYKLKCVRITNFSSAKSLIELICHILESAMSLECLTLDTTHGAPRCSVMKTGRCWPMKKDALMEAHRALSAVQTYVKSKVPSTVELNVFEPCSQ
ncbi:hypothetical protein BRADI_1g51680v3 [Brachypodium distachyon]|uniref:At1g61320/AtMIF1 LRR domain-containing protein n=1 Tax=Brachypodium distachyon TaxID=15368 RepID=A0A0Q3S447_BRADI|nr:hypothetical protein BRADI_1g51680v3 [Brachypodium distachyon]